MFYVQSTSLNFLALPYLFKHFNAYLFISTVYPTSVFELLITAYCMCVLRLHHI